MFTKVIEVCYTSISYVLFWLFSGHMMHRKELHRLKKDHVRKGKELWKLKGGQSLLIRSER